MARIALVKPDKARAIEDMIIAAARRGQLGEKVSEERLIGLLEQVGEGRRGRSARALGKAACSACRKQPLPFSHFVVACDLPGQ